MLKNKRDIIEDFEAKVIDDEKYQENEIEYKEEICEVLWIKQHAFAIDFKGFGLSFHVLNNHYFDTDKINKNYIHVKYEDEIGSPNFKIYPIYE